MLILPCSVPPAEQSKVVGTLPANNLPASQASRDTIECSVMDIASLFPFALPILVNFCHLQHPLARSFTEWLLVKNTRAQHSCGTVVMLCVCSCAAFFIGPVLSLSSLKNKVSKQKLKFHESYLWREACIHYSFLVYHEATLVAVNNSWFNSFFPRFLPKYVASASAHSKKLSVKFFWGNALYLIRFFSFFKTICFQ